MTWQHPLTVTSLPTPAVTGHTWLISNHIPPLDSQGLWLTDNYSLLPPSLCHTVTPGNVCLHSQEPGLTSWGWELLGRHQATAYCVSVIGCSVYYLHNPPWSGVQCAPWIRVTAGEISPRINIVLLYCITHAKGGGLGIDWHITMLHWIIVRPVKCKHTRSMSDHSTLAIMILELAGWGLLEDWCLSLIWVTPCPE